MIASCGETNKTSSQIDYTEFKNKEYWEVVSQRAAKIVNNLELEDTTKAKLVQDIVAAQYYRLNEVHDANKNKIDALKETGLPESELNAKIDELKSAQEIEVDKLKNTYIETLSAQLTQKQVDEIKDGMTYHVLPKTYAAFLDMIQDLTEEQKTYIMNALVEAREHAISAGSSKEKHGWFGKYKGRINNYLAKEGYDLNKLSKEWQERLKAQGVEL